MYLRGWSGSSCTRVSSKSGIISDSSPDLGPSSPGLDGHENPLGMVSVFSPLSTSALIPLAGLYDYILLGYDDNLRGKRGERR